MKFRFRLMITLPRLRFFRIRRYRKIVKKSLQAVLAASPDLSFVHYHFGITTIHPDPRTRMPRKARITIIPMEFEDCTVSEEAGLTLFLQWALELTRTTSYDVRVFVGRSQVDLTPILS